VHSVSGIVAIVVGFCWFPVIISTLYLFDCYDISYDTSPRVSWRSNHSGQVTTDP